MATLTEASGTAPPPRVLMLTKGLGRGGAERLLAGMTRHIDRDRFRVEIAYLLPWKDAFVEEIEAAGTPVHCLDAPRPLHPGWLGRLRRLTEDRSIDLVHTHMPLPAAQARLALPRRGGPVFVHTEHNLWSRYRRPTRWANALTYRRNAAAVAVSEGVAASIRSRVPVQTVVHGIEVDVLTSLGADARHSARSRLGLPADAPVVGTVGNFTAKKDHATLVRAFAELTASQPHTRLVLVGIGPLQDELVRLVHELGVEQSVLFTGMRSDIYELMTALDVFALSSRFEGLPIALLEAMAAGTAPVATAVGGIPEVITDGLDGLLVPPDDAPALAAALAKVLSDPPLRNGLAEAARQRAGQFDLVRAVRTIEDVYAAALASAARR